MNSQEKHLIVLDLDGTLLTDEKKISSKTHDILKKARHKGHEVMIATGRPFRASELYYQQLQLTTPIVNFNGAFVHHPTDPSWGVYHEPMDLDVAKQIINACDDFPFRNIVAEVMDDVYLHYHDEKIIDVFMMGNPSISTGDIRNVLSDHPTSMLIHAEEEDVADIRAHLDDVHAELIDHRRWAAPWHIIEIVKSGLNKAVGIERVASSLNIPQERIIAFGDEDNDLEMLDYAGTGVAMGNAIDPLKDIANEVTLSNEEDGIGRYLQKRFDL
ncbi:MULTISPECIES: Cof-type HAD-IIB family hydrolase [Rossellomorea]|jgi:5-amino-6-(5-phospho-D-ribitylamino)uracil phosphatase|uniref:Cof-type HAD-IIB family hydrolase n=1 Tax=Rossellomorea vietnamensis TaxID=218284 RepID=A0A6I6UHH6_9BACI|nr:MULTISPECIES: Cof-type HAD-IIB family hydrolase [Rossellomorea]MCA0148980.1 Cof-type HAD-IIB family hydrolase [Rossellomorea vietnamensis]MCC5803040.1 Cof-type HAD-IIB family hydrolase [Rossellomorea vietnamensis]QHE60977.1 Cof-type HAD-IIB family hydrolase [Rossellomorea vietnamensis]UTE79120.1 Cof-type HAD-IIB family hydrolase [Rossellomorea sp. KS-H15a]WGG47187.1 Cof-type HAD-IIB family hydrolase [Rossellomorea sp. DA94]